MFKPMLSGKCENIAKLTYPVIASPKLDGIRCIILNGVAYSRNLKPIPNLFIQECVKGLPHGLDGELICGPANAPDAFRRSTSCVMSEFSADENNVYFYSFDLAGPHGFSDRLREAADKCGGHPFVKPVFHSLIHSEETLDLYEASILDQGYEGVMLRAPNGPYKYGRSTEREGWLLKLKRFEDAEAVVVGYEEQQYNGNAATLDALGRTKRTSHAAGKVGKGVLGALVVRGANGPYRGVEFNIGTGFDDAQRAELWGLREHLVGRIVKYRFFPSGSKDKPRFPVFLGFRHSGDMS
jgi:DNA ligase-1